MSLWPSSPRTPGPGFVAAAWSQQTPPRTTWSPRKEETISYDALLIAVGAVKRDPYSHVLAFGTPGTEERMHGLVQDLEGGYVRRIAFVVPPGTTWPLPLYELALMAAERAYDSCQHCELVLVTSEEAPLALFGAEASHALSARLQEAGVAVRTGVHAEVPHTAWSRSIPAASS